MLAASINEGMGAAPQALEEERAAHLETLYRLTDRLYRAPDLEAILSAALDSITEGLGCERCSILLFDEAGVMRFVAWRGLSDAYRAQLEGHTPWEPGAHDPPPIFVPDIDVADEADEVKTIIRGEGIRSLAFIPLTAQGRVIGKFMSYRPAPHHYSKGAQALAVTIARQLGFSIERAQAERARRAALRDLQESEERFRLMAEHAPVMIWMCDAGGRCLHLNQMLRRFWKVEDDGISSFDWRSSLHPEDADGVMAQMGDALARRSRVSVTARYRSASGEFRILETVAHPRFGNDGTFMGLTGVNIDITQRRKAEDQRELLLAELNHRVKNTLAVVQGLAHQTFRRTDENARHAFEGRLLALATAHDLLTRSHWESTSLQQLAKDTLQLGGGMGQRIEAQGPPVSLSPRAALSIALAFHELLTNALKYGALSNDTGRVNLAWTLNRRQGKLQLLWREEGGPPVRKSGHRGFGSFLLERTLASDLQGRVDVDYEPTGVTCLIEMPMPETGGDACPG
jgi:PAS domain S-box-containing protein